MSDFCDYSKLLDTGYTREVFNEAAQKISQMRFQDVEIKYEKVASLDETSFGSKITLVKFIDNLDIFIPVIFIDSAAFFEVIMTIQFRNDYELTKLCVEIIEELNVKLAENGSSTGFKKCAIKPIYDEPMHIQISRNFEKTTNLEEDTRMLFDMCVDMLSLPISFYRTLEKRVMNEKKSSTNAESGGCYVATAIYGSYDCPQVWTLRRYRDYTLAKSWYGRFLIKAYYAISPTIVKWFGHTKWFKKMWQGKLDRMVVKLQANGVESTPYKDKEW